MAETSITTGDINAAGAVVVGSDNDVRIFITNSSDYKDLQLKKTEAASRLSKYPKDPEFLNDLRNAEENIKQYEREISNLYREIHSIKINTQRSTLAKEHFNKGDIASARAAIDLSELFSELDLLLAKDDNISKEQKNNNDKKELLVSDFLLKAKLTSTDFSLGEKRIETVISIYDNALLASRNAIILYNYASFLLLHNFYKRASIFYLELVSVLQNTPKESPDIDNLNLLYSSYSNLGNAYTELNDNDLALNYFHKALEGFKELAITKPAFLAYVSATHNSIALIYCENDMDEKALLSYQSAMETSLSNNNNSTPFDKYIFAGLLTNIANLQTKKGDVKEALLTSQKALEIFQELYKVNDRNYAIAYSVLLNNVGSLYFRFKEDDIALKFYTNALGIQKNITKIDPSRNNDHLANTLNNLTNLYFRIDNIKKAIHMSKEAIEITRKMSHESPTFCLDLAKSLLRSSKLHSINKSTNEALIAINEAKVLLIKLTKLKAETYSVSLIEQLNQAASSYRDMDKIDESIELYRNAIIVWDGIESTQKDMFSGSMILIFATVAYLYSVHDDNHTKLALLFYNRALKVLNTLPRDKTKEELFHEEMVHNNIKAINNSSNR